jgi:short-subunit dehydrogenase
MDKKFKKRYGPWALIAGASQGIGEAFAREIAKEGINVILVARRKYLLDKISEEIEEIHKVKAMPFQADLTNPNILSLLDEKIANKEISLLVYNAALSPRGPFLNTSLQTHEQTIKLNCLGPMKLTHHFGQKMKKRGKGGIILMSSMAGFQGSPFVAHYSATKAYNRVLAEALWEELGQYGVNVMACVAGATSTPNFRDANPQETKGFSPPVMEPKEVAKQALKTLPKNKPFMVPGLVNKVSSFLMRKIFPKKMAINIMGNVNRQMFDKSENEDVTN